MACLDFITKPQPRPTWIEPPELGYDLVIPETIYACDSWQPTSTAPEPQDCNYGLGIPRVSYCRQHPQSDQYCRLDHSDIKHPRYQAISSRRILCGLTPVGLLLARRVHASMEPSKARGGAEPMNRPMESCRCANALAGACRVTKVGSGLRLRPRPCTLRPQTLTSGFSSPCRPMALLCLDGQQCDSKARKHETLHARAPQRAITSPPIAHRS